MASANLQYRVNAGALHTDSIEVSGGDVISQTAASFAGWGTPAARWEIVAYPPDWPLPAGWTLDVSTGYYYYLANSGASGVTPPDITIPATSSYWGKWLFRLTVNGSIVSSTIGVETLSPTLGLHDLAAKEGAQFGGTRNWPGPHQENLRTVDDSALVGGGFVASLAATTPIAVDAPTGAVTISWNPTADVSLASHKLTNVTNPTSAQDAATKAYVDAVAAGLDPKGSVYLASTAADGNITKSGSQSVDSVASGTTGKRILLKRQTDPIENGIWITAAGAWSRSTDLAVGASAAGVYCFAEAGATQADKGFVCTNNDGSDVVGTDGLAFTQFTGGSGADATAVYWEDDTTALNTNGVATRNLAASLSVSGQAGVVPIKLYTAGVAASDVEAFRVSRTVSDGGGLGTSSTQVHLSLAMPNGAGADTKFAAIAAQLTSTIGPSGKLILRTLNGGTLSDWVTLGNSGNVRLHGATYASAGVLHSDGSGNLTTSAIVGGDITAPLTLTLDDATANTVLSVLTLKRTTSDGGFGVAGIGAQLVFQAEDAAGNVEDAAYVTGRLTTTTDGAEASEWAAWTRTGGAALAKNAYLDGSGLWTTTGGVASTTITASTGFIGPKWDAASAIALQAGDVNATSLDVKNGTALLRLYAGSNLAGSIAVAATYLKLTNNAAGASSGIYVQSAGIALFEGLTTVAITSNAGDVWIQPSTSGATQFYAGSGQGATFTHSPTAAQSLVMVVRSGTGANAGVTWDLKAQPGQDVAAGTNNDGGILRLSSGIPGTGGTGGVDGNLILRTGATERINAAGSGATLTLTATTIAVTGALTVSSTTALADTTTVTKSGFGTTKTRGLTVINATTTTSVSPQLGLTAWHTTGTTQHNAGWQLEPQSDTRVRVALYTGTGTGAPASGNGGNGALVYDSSESNLGECVIAAGFACGRSGFGGAGYRFVDTANNGGMDLDGSSNLRLKSYSAKGITASIYSDSGSTLTSSPVAIAGTGKGTFRAIPDTPTSSSNAMTINLTTSQHADHTTTENTTVTITGGSNGQEGTIVFSQGASGKTITMPTNGVGVEYDNDIAALTTTGIIDTTALTRTLLAYRTLSNGKAYIYARSVNTIP